MLLDRFQISTRLQIIIAIVVLASFLQLALSLNDLMNAMMQERKLKLHSIVEAAHAIVSKNGELARSGALSEEEAKQRALDSIDAIRFEGDNYMFVVDFDAHLVLHPIRPELNGKDMGNFADENGTRLFAEFAQAGQQNEGGYVEYVWPKPGSDKPIEKLSYSKGYKPWGWSIATGVYIDDVYAAFQKELIKLGSILLVSVAVLVFITLAISRSITRPVSLMTQFMKRLAEGDKSQEVPALERVDEIGHMANAVQIFKDNMIKADTLAAEQEVARQEREKRAKSIEKLTTNFDSDVGGVIKNVAEAASLMDTTSSSMAGTADETSRQATMVAAASEQASANVQTVASASEELSGSISEISRQVSESSMIASKAVEEVNGADEQVQGLAEAANKIGQVVALITDIADQTNLLALNATIEAARAGEAGKGFAVVASEVKNLAKQTARATEEISGQINGIQGATQNAVNAIQSIGSIIEQMSEISASIASAVEEQGAATQEIARNVEEAATGTSEVSSNIVRVTGGAQNTRQAAGTVQDAAGDLSLQTENLRRIVEKFLADVKAA